MSATGSSIGNGCAERPWHLETALNATAYIKPGDTIWIPGGVYETGLISTDDMTNTATSANRITIRGNPGDWKAGNYPIIKGGLNLTRRHVRLQNVMVTGISNERWIENDSTSPDSNIAPPGISKFAEGVQVINCVVIDANGNGHGDWSAAPNSLTYGTLFHNCGWMSPSRDGNLYDASGNRNSGRFAHGHGSYFQKSTDNTESIMKHNLFLPCFGFTFSGFGGDGHIANVTVRQNVFFGFRGEIGNAGSSHLVEGAIVDDNVAWNMAFQVGQFPFGGSASIMSNVFKTDASNYLQLTGLAGGSATGNRIINDAGNVALVFARKGAGGISLDGNTYIATSDNIVAFDGESLGHTLADMQAAGYEASGQHIATLPSANVHHIWPNEYPDDIRAGIVVVENWEGVVSDEIDLSALNLTNGATYKLINAFNYLGDTPLEYTSNGDDGAVSLDLSGWTMAKPTGTANGVAINEPLDPMPEDLMVFIVESAGSP